MKPLHVPDEEIYFISKLLAFVMGNLGIQMIVSNVIRTLCISCLSTSIWEGTITPLINWNLYKVYDWG